MDTTCHYKILGLLPEASDAQIKYAYALTLRRFSLQMRAGRTLPAERFDAICMAYKVLSNPDTRATYDRHRLAKSKMIATLLLPVLTPIARPAAVMPRNYRRENTKMRIEFNGQGAEYFRLWLANIVLSILTLGIYSAWAKVRREKYFHRNLTVDGAAFDYHGKPKAILLGRLTFVILSLILGMTEKLGWAAYLGGLAVFAMAYPWLMVQSLRFRARNTSYCGLRFSFSGTYRQALSLYLLHGGLVMLTLGLYLPAFIAKQKQFLGSHLQFGDRQCEFFGTAGNFFRAMAAPIGVGILVPLAGIAGLVLPFRHSNSLPAFMNASSGVLALIGGCVLAYVLVMLSMRLIGIKLFWNYLAIGESSFISTQEISHHVGLIVTNYLLTLLTLGFFVPFGQIRLARFRAANLLVLNPDALRGAIDGVATNAGALGSESMDALGFEISY